MAGLTNDIEQFLLSLLEDCSDGSLEIGRNELAQKFDCAPSQINYVLMTRFTPYNGYYIESRRGGAGFIRIVRLSREPHSLVQRILEDPGLDQLTTDKCKHIITALENQGIISREAMWLMRLATDDQALRGLDNKDRKTVRARILKNMLLAYVK
ncbi:CtsR family transcriptional regulator [Kallipyga gabonensis]|uniref:CtsR family transcriptional regulator n=1 Tax=Kallipyga gabonensis TaxID=1686287 RepID=UPI0006B4123C|nr:CtsR family transcriptional regulator [Kallipyga gabonensis]